MFSSPEEWYYLGMSDAENHPVPSALEDEIKHLLDTSTPYTLANILHVASYAMTTGKDTPEYRKNIA